MEPKVSSRNAEDSEMASSSRAFDFSDPFAVSEFIRDIDCSGRFGSVTQEMQNLMALKQKILSPLIARHRPNPNPLKTTSLSDNNSSLHNPIVLVDSDEEKNDTNSMLTLPHLKPYCDAKINCQRISVQSIREECFQPVILDPSNPPVTVVVEPIISELPVTKPEPVIPRKKRTRKEEKSLPKKPRKKKVTRSLSELKLLTCDTAKESPKTPRFEEDDHDMDDANQLLSSLFERDSQQKSISQEKHEITTKAMRRANPGTYVGVEDDDTIKDDDDGFRDLWNEMSSALELMKDVPEDAEKETIEEEEEVDCDHSFILKDDLGYVCRVCGIVNRRIETIIEIQFVKDKPTRTYAPKGKSFDDSHLRDGFDFDHDDLFLQDIVPHPRHRKLMKTHQLEGFRFLCKNLAGDEPGGCIMAHAPGSGKTFMIISFIQSFLARDPNARPLVVMPKGLLPTWRREFDTWRIEEIPIYDFYSVKADSRVEQLEVLNKWIDKKSVLFLGYKQFASIVCGEVDTKAASCCQEILLKRPSVMILDEGHTPRNEDTNVLQSISRVLTPLKIVLSGTLYQNHVKEVFNILRLVRPSFLEMTTSKETITRVLSKVRKISKSDVNAAFFDAVEDTIQMDENFNRKIAVIRDLREMTSGVLHYYKGDFLDELPGLTDFTVVLKLTSKQKAEVEKLKKYKQKFKRNSVGSAAYLHPSLSSTSDESLATDEKIEKVVERCDLREGVKLRFFMNMLNLCVMAKEKVLVFSQFLPPLKFLEKVITREKGWRIGFEMFSISGDSTMEERELSMEQFNKSPNARVFFGSIKACGEGISLVGASRVVILDVHLNPAVTRQAIGRAFRPGQQRKVFVYRLIAGDSPEEDDSKVCYKKELIAKMWFEWNEWWDHRKLEMERIDVGMGGISDDPLLDNALFCKDVRELYRRYY